jgi:hypothetical protein
MRAENDPAKRIEWQNMAKGYRRLAEQADRNAQNHLIYEPPLPRVAQQQPQPKPEEDK